MSKKDSLLQKISLACLALMTATTLINLPYCEVDGYFGRSLDCNAEGFLDTVLNVWEVLATVASVNAFAIATLGTISGVIGGGIWWLPAGIVALIYSLFCLNGISVLFVYMPKWFVSYIRKKKND